RFNDARAKQRGADEVVKVHQARVDRLQKLSGGQVVARKELDDALTALADSRTQSALAKAAVELWRKALEMVTRRGDGASAGWSEPLTAASAGEVTELAARPGMSIEAGGLIARLVDFRRPLVRLDVSPEAMVGAPPQQVELFTAASGVEAPD